MLQPEGQGHPAATEAEGGRVSPWLTFIGLVGGAAFFYLLGYYMAKTYWQDRGYEDALRHREALSKAATHQSREWRGAKR